MAIPEVEFGQALGRIDENVKSNQTRATRLAVVVVVLLLAAVALAVAVFLLARAVSHLSGELNDVRDTTSIARSNGKATGRLTEQTNCVTLYKASWDQAVGTVELARLTGAQLTAAQIFAFAKANDDLGHLGKLCGVMTVPFDGGPLQPAPTTAAPARAPSRRTTTTAAPTSSPSPPATAPGQLCKLLGVGC